MAKSPPLGPLLVVAPFAAVIRVLLVPFLEATILRRPWIVAIPDSGQAMLWRATGRTAAKSAVDEVADALARGEERPTPLSARWLGYATHELKLGPPSEGA